MTVKDIIEKLLTTDYVIINHWNGFEYSYTSDIADRPIERLLVENNRLVISI